MALSIMLQGTMSNVGKSLLTAALCRIFMRNGYLCAPFKSQNMALNSYVTRDGFEMGRAQAVQAEAAKTEPSVLMNPILLKPTADNGSQVIVNGVPVGNMRAAKYFKYRKELMPQIISAYRELEKSYDIIVIEGAGSPAEMNLKKDDIVNMGLAKAVKSPVLLIGDIDRGGVFAQLLGTLDLLDADERGMIKGLIVNKFRGDRSLFTDGIKFLEGRGQIPVVGTVPYIDCDIGAEDSLSEKLERKSAGEIDIAVIRLPRISNFTDFDAFDQFKNVSVRYVTGKNELGAPDLIILPGTKSSIADMLWLRESGLEDAARERVKSGTPMFGICGGYQMLGKKISDPHNAEGGGSITGMGLLDTETVFREEKKRVRVRGKISRCGGIFKGFGGAAFEGYEIHMGETVSKERPLIIYADGSAGGAARGNVYGTYVHGIFDSADILGAVIKALCERKGVKYIDNAVGVREYKERQYDILADAVEDSLNMDLVYKILREGL